MYISSFARKNSRRLSAAMFRTISSTGLLLLSLLGCVLSIFMAVNKVALISVNSTDANTFH